MKKEALRVPVKKLRRSCDSAHFNFGDTSEVEPLKDFIGQKRAIEALRLGLEIESPGYNIFVTGHTGTGKKAVIREHLERFAEERRVSGEVVLKDFCYIYNFDDPDKPKILIFEKGKGKKLKAGAEGILKALKKKIPALFQSEE